MPDDTVFHVTISVENGTGEDEEGFAEAANIFLTDLRRVDEFDVEVPEVTEEGTRGVVAALTAIGIWASNAGAFKVIASLAKALFDRFHGAEIQLKFKDGSVLTLKGLTETAARDAIEKHLSSQRA